jgi:drug/metabolite transporter (DMT)-like permease
MPNRYQIMGMFLVLVGAILFFGDSLYGINLAGFLITLLSGVGWAGYMVAGKFLFNKEKISPLANTAFAMGFGTILLSFSAFFLEGLSVVSFSGWVIITWLGVVNTAAAFFLWNNALDRIDAFELSILQNTMLIQIALLSIVFLGEYYSLEKYFFMGLIFIGVLMVQLVSK